MGCFLCNVRDDPMDMTTAEHGAICVLSALRSNVDLQLCAEHRLGVKKASDLLTTLFRRDRIRKNTKAIEEAAARRRGP